jgi:nucleoside-diphosphate-sugar epimerase
MHSLASLIGLTDQLASIQTSWQGQEPPSSTLAPDFGYFLLGSPDRCHRLYDNTRIRREIGDYARWSVARGLAATLNWYYSAGMFPGALHTARPQRIHTCMSH